MSTTDVERLASWRTLGARRSIEVVDLGPRVLKAGGLGDQGEHLFVSPNASRTVPSRKLTLDFRMVRTRASRHRCTGSRSNRVGGRAARYTAKEV
jgi:hypothetical protein